MADYKHEEIAALIKDIESGILILPAIQRNFVWPEDKICKLFDSLTHDYPIGTFLFWNVDKDTVSNYSFNKFISKYDEQKGKVQRGEKVEPLRDEYVGVLDGQQRITSLYVGIKGSIRARKKGYNKNLESSYIEKYLCIDILNPPTDDNNEYSFRFMAPDDIGTIITNMDPEVKDEFWVRVSEVYDESFEAADYIEAIEENHFEGSMPLEDRKAARTMLKALNTAIFVKPNVNYYEAKQNDLAEVVDIFVRVNSGGQKLSASDLMLSVATGEKEDEDIHVKIQEAIESIYNATGGNEEKSFVADKELILIAGLMFTGAESLSLQKKDSYSRPRINEILDHWDEIIDALCIAAKYIDGLGFNGKKLTSKNLILPVAYYFYKNPSLGDGHISAANKRAQKDRVFIRQWLLRAMINSIFRDGTGGTLRFIRNVIDNKKTDYFPLDYLMESEQKRSLKISISTIEEILEYKYPDVRIDPLLIELTKGYYGADYHVDHIWPQAKLQVKKELNRLLPTSDENMKKRFKDKCNILANLELLSSSENTSKGCCLFDEWVALHHTSDPDDRYYDVNFIPRDTSYNFDAFESFLERRNELLTEAISDALPKDFDEIVKRYGL